jgi:hypothetical protein
MQLSDVSDGVHKCDHTRGAGRKQLDDGVDHTFVLAPPGVRRSVRFFSLGSGESIPKYNRRAPTGWLILLWELTRGPTAGALGEELL